MSLWPKKKQWNSWSLPSKLTAIGALLGFLSFGLYFSEKVFNIIDWASQDDQESILRPEISIDMQFPYEQQNDAVKQDKRNPKLTITNRGLKVISPLKADVTMFFLNQSFDEVSSAAILSYRTHGHSIFEPELKPGLSTSISLPGIRNWNKPAAYRIVADVVTSDGKELPSFSLLYLVDKDGIKAEGSKLSKSIAGKINGAIKSFENNENLTTKLTLYAPIDGVWVPYAEPGTNLEINEDGTLTVK